MTIPVAQFRWRDYRAVSIPVDYVMQIDSLPGYPQGIKGQPLGELWASLAQEGAPGLIAMDQDVVADPDDLAAMTEAAEAAPEDIHVAPVKLWPASTQRSDWIWAHRGGTVGFPAATQDESTPIVYWTTNFSYMPARLLDAAVQLVRGWDWVVIDVHLPELALQLGIPARLVPACRPKHLHF